MVRNKSFTVIELLITVTFILLFSGISIGYYSNYTEQKKLENATRKVSTVLSLVRQKTVSGDATMCAQVGVTPAIDYYAFQVPNPTTYKIQPFCSKGTAKPVSFTNEASIIFITSVPPTPPLPVVTFFPVTGNSVCNYIYLKNVHLSGGKQCRYIKVSQSGVVSDDYCSDCASCPTTCP